VKLSKIIQQMRADWDARATIDSKYYIASWKKNWDSDKFFESGEADVRALTADFFSANHFDPSDKVMLEIGCGIGRMTHAFAKRFKAVYGTDVSMQMLVQAVANLADYSNVFLSLGSGHDLSQFANNSVDFCFSYIVFQHIPDPAITLNYFREISRVLKHGGLFKVHVRSRRSQLLFRLAWKVRRWLYRNFPERRIPILDTHEQFDSLEREKIERCETWSGSSISWKDVQRTLRDSDLIYGSVPAGPGGLRWIYGSKRS
jgi:ubiquinone/menaquinone biosynthesis C-methylase UbiE